MTKARQRWVVDGKAQAKIGVAGWAGWMLVVEGSGVAEVQGFRSGVGGFDDDNGEDDDGYVMDLMMTVLKRLG